MKLKLLVIVSVLSLGCWPAWSADAKPSAGREIHVSVNGDDANDGSKARPKKTISAAAQEAQPGDTVTVHAGIYRERVTPPRGGESDAKRIVYQAAPGEKVEILGSEIWRDWKPVMEGAVWKEDRIEENTSTTGKDGKALEPLPGLWKATIPNTFFGDFNPYKDVVKGDWFSSRFAMHTGEIYLNGKSLYEAGTAQFVMPQAFIPFYNTRSTDKEGATYTWFCSSDEKNTYIYAQFHDKDPNKELVEINVRRTVFYPDKPGVNYITVRGFTMGQAATAWAPPTAEQIGVIGSHWSKGWIIENNIVHDSKFAGITLGKYGDEWDNKAGTAQGYQGTIKRARENGWLKDNIGHHIVRNNTVYNCEQAGVCGSLGAIYSEFVNNHIYDIYTKRQYDGYEMAGIKIHGAIDSLIKHNRIHNAYFGLWLDWMAQGTRITGNLCYDNSYADVIMEMNHGPFLLDNNIFLSDIAILDESEGGSYVHNLIAGKVSSERDGSRAVPFFAAHSIDHVGDMGVLGGDDRFYNNIFLSPTRTSEEENKRVADIKTNKNQGYGLWVFDGSGDPANPYLKRAMKGVGSNVYLNGARPFAEETTPCVLAAVDPKFKVVKDADHVTLELNIGAEIKEAQTALVTTETLGTSTVSKLSFENPDGTPVSVDTDYFGKKRNVQHPTAGPFEELGKSGAVLKVW